MALSLASPGIKVREVDLTRGGINNTTSLSAGIAAPFEKGPVNEAITILNEKELVDIFGRPSKNDYHYEYWYSASNFMSYGGSLKVVRCSGSGLNNSNAGVGVGTTTSLLIENYDDYQEDHSSATNFYWAAKNPGYWADGLKVCVIDNFADQTIAGVNTASIQVGYAVTQALSGTVAGVGTTAAASGFLKGIVTGVGSSEFYVKIVSKVSAGTTTAQEYTENGIYAFNTGSSLYVDGALSNAGNPVLSITRNSPSTSFGANSIGSGTSLSVLDIAATTTIDNAGSTPLLNSDTTLYVASATGITTSQYLLIGNEILDVISVSGNQIGVARSTFGTSAAESVSDGSTVKVLTYNQNVTTASATVDSSSTTVEVASIAGITEGDYVINESTDEIFLVNSISQSAVVTSSTINDWYNTQNILDIARGDSVTVSWRSIAPKPRTNQYVRDRNGNNDALHVVVVDSARSKNISGSSQTILEKFTNLSKATDTEISPSQGVYYKDYVALNSAYIYAGKSIGDNATDDYWGIDPVATKFSFGNTPQSESLGVWGVECDNVTFNSVGNKAFTLTGGKDYSGENGVGGFAVTLSDIVDAYDKLSNADEVPLNFLLQGSASLGKEIEQAKANTLISIAENRKDCVAFISPYREGVVNVAQTSTQLANILSFFSPLTSSSYAVFDSGYQYVYDRYNKEFVYIPCSGDTAGLCVRTDINQFPWYSPAGKVRGTLRFPIKLSYNPNQDDRDKLYSQRINPIISSPGSGIILFGDKTALSYTSAFDRINVRRLFITIEQAIKSAADAQLFEFNDAATRANFINIVEPYLRDVQAKRGIQDFLLVCDDSNNTPDVIDRNEFIADIYVKPARSINFIGLTFVATRTGVSFETVVGTV
jgi:hypothetical protein